MARKRHTPEQVINKLREAEVAIAEGSAPHIDGSIGGSPYLLLAYSPPDWGYRKI